MKNQYILMVDGKEVDRGSAQELAEKYESSLENIRSCYIYKRLFKRKYTIKLGGVIRNNSFQYYVSKDGEIIYKGSKSDIALVLRKTKAEIDHCVRYGGEMGDYIITRKLVPTKDIERLKVYDDKVLKPKTKRIDYLIKHLNEYGNTVLGCLPEQKVKEYMLELAERGINATYKRVKYDDDLRHWYLIERV